MTISKLSDLACGDGGCVFGHPGGMHTNGGCRCFAVSNDKREMREMMRNARKAIYFLRAEVDELKELLEREKN